MDESATKGRVSHILFADDALLFCDASKDELRYVMATLVCFECVTWLKVNLHKTSLFAIGNVPNAAYFASLVGCKREFLPTLYLGLPLGARASSKGIWDPVVASLEKRVSAWSSRFLSLGGRITLLKSVLTGIPVYYMSLLKAPAQVIKQMEAS
ncbi:hypothetical protein LINPERHAP2_LOCUS8110 [Linum perenne]